jgi:hypothetical protein
VQIQYLKKVILIDLNNVYANKSITPHEETFVFKTKNLNVIYLV